MNKNKLFVIGLTGGIGSGKSTVAQLFARHGTPLLDADQIARDLTAIEQPAWEKISAHFGAGILQADRSLNRPKLRQLIFDNREQRLWLEQTLHPLIRQEIKTALAQLAAPYCIVTIPLLIETGPYEFINRILVVDTPEATQLERLKTRDQTSAEELQKIIQSQATRETRLAAAQDRIHNNGDLAELQEQVDALHHFYVQLSQK